MALIRPLSKKNPNLDHEALNNYRPISNLQFFSIIIYLKKRNVADLLLAMVTGATTILPLLNLKQRESSVSTAIMRPLSIESLAMVFLWGRSWAHSYSLSTCPPG